MKLQPKWPSYERNVKYAEKLDNDVNRIQVAPIYDNPPNGTGWQHSKEQNKLSELSSPRISYSNADNVMKLKTVF